MQSEVNLKIPLAKPELFQERKAAEGPEVADGVVEDAEGAEARGGGGEGAQGRERAKRQLRLRRRRLQAQRPRFHFGAEGGVLEGRRARQPTLAVGCVSG